MTSTYDSAESIATLPPESDLDDEQLRNMLASLTAVLTGERGKCRPITSLSLIQIKLSVTSSSHFRDSAGKPAVMFSHTQKVEPRNTVRFRAGVSSGHQPVQGKDEILFRLSETGM